MSVHIFEFKNFLLNFSSHGQIRYFMKPRFPKIFRPNRQFQFSIPVRIFQLPMDLFNFPLTLCQIYPQKIFSNSNGSLQFSSNIGSNLFIEKKYKKMNNPSSIKKGAIKKKDNSSSWPNHFL